MPRSSVCRTNKGDMMPGLLYNVSNPIDQAMGGMQNAASTAASMDKKDMEVEKPKKTFGGALQGAAGGSMMGYAVSPMLDSAFPTFFATGAEAATGAGIGGATTATGGAAVSGGLAATTGTALGAGATTGAAAGAGAGATTLGSSTAAGASAGSSAGLWGAGIGALIGAAAYLFS